MLQARLELAPRLSPDWILSPTRLPIPPLERGLSSINFSKMLCFSASTDLSKNLTFSQLFLGRVPLERGLCSIKFSKMLCFSASTDLSKNLTFSQLFLGRVPLDRGQKLFSFQICSALARLPTSRKT